jgi:PmbA protein
VVLGHEAVATVLDHLRAAFGVHLDLGGGPLAGRFGSRVAAPAINLSDSCRYPGTLPRSYDAEGVPRQPVPLIQDGVAHRRVHDSASAARHGAQSTGHATRPAALAPMPEQLVLVGGGADDVAALAAPVAAGLYVPALSPAREADGDTFRHTTIGAVAIRDGELAAPVADVEVVIDPLGVLATVEALTGRQRLVALRADTPGGLGAAVVPALRARDGVRLSA